MASVGGVSSSSSIYGNRNVLTGLATGMDTESMIENAISGIKARISSLGQKRTKVEWQQEAYRSIIDKLAGFNSKYTSYNSSTNLLSSSFFNKSVITTAHGDNASKVSVTGKSSSDITLNGVKQLATAARKSISADGLYDTGALEAGASFDLTRNMDVSAVSGQLKISYGNNNDVYLGFDDMEKFENPQALVDAINKKLEDETVSFSTGSKKASEAIEAVLDDKGNITFKDKTDAGNSIKIAAAGDFKKLMDGDSQLATKGIALTETKSTQDYLEGKKLSFTLDGVTKSIVLPGKDDLKDVEGANNAERFMKYVQDQVDEAFGPNKIKVENKDTSGLGTVKLQFSPANTATDPKLKVFSEAHEVLGLGEFGMANYLDTSKTLESMGLKKETEGENKGKYTLSINGKDPMVFDGDATVESVMLAINSDDKSDVKVSYSSITNKFVFTSKATGADQKVELSGTLAAAPAAENGGLFGGASEGSGVGTDAVFSVTVNGDEKTLTRSSNVVDLDGMKVTLNDTFGYKEAPKVDESGNPVYVQQVDENGETKVDGSGNPMYVQATDENGQPKFDENNNPVYLQETDLVPTGERTDAVTFTSKSDSEKIVEVIKSMVEDYNAMVTEIKSAYSTQPAEKNSATHTRYEPLTDADKEDMSEEAIKAYEAKAKQGILFADNDLSSLYSKLRNAISPSGEDGSLLRSIGISTEYSDGLTTLHLDETALRNALETNPDSVKEAFTKTKEGGASSNGLMQNLKTQLDNYASTIGSTKGVLIEKAGSPLAPTSILKNSLKSQLDNIDKQILKWETKMADQIDMYTTKFSRLEQLTAQMNSQSSMLMGMMMGNSQ